ncbi:MAG TPA: hypothetical protein VFU33_05045 [Gaiellaceae bacterium]|nr:hypothetical protein [Gaiellaceae bacterium]
MIAPPRPGSHDELEALIKEARARQLRRRLLGAAGVAIAAAIGLGVYAFVTGRRTDHPNDGSPTARLAAPLCRASQLSSTAGLNGAAGTIDGTVILTNTTAGACSFPTGRPHVNVLWRGHVLPTRESGEVPPSGRSVPVLGPHRGVAIDMDWANWCGRLDRRPAIAPTFRLSWAGRLVVYVPNGVAAQPRCNGGGTSVISVGRPYRNRLLAP